jgi:3alpha(or 20beta)-hydroxysteroid dehydrogenase
MGRLEGKVALVTGAARGTGAVTARRFVAEGARVVIADVLDDPGKSVADDLGSAARYQHLDVTHEADWERALAETQREFGTLDVLVNNAAVLNVAALADHTLEDFTRVVSVNLIGPFLGIRSAIEPMRQAGGGSIVNVSSIDGLEGMNGVAAYASSKWGLRGLARVAALELGAFGIRVNTVCPAAGSFDMVRPFIPKGVSLEAVAAAHPEPVLVRREPRDREAALVDVANLITFLASDESASCTGADFPVDSGYTAGKIIRGAPGR